MSEPVRVKRIEVKGLFGLYDHTIDLKMEDRVTILHGPNGVGKTALLRMVKAALATDPKRLSARPFDELRLQLSDARVLEITPEWYDRKERRWPPKELRYRVTKNASPSDNGQWEATFEVATGFFLPALVPPAWLEELSAQLPVRLVETQRVLMGESSPSPTVDWIARDLAAKIADCLSRYANESQEMTRTFLQRVLRTNGTGPSPEDIRVRVRAVQAELERLSALGLLHAGDEVQSSPVTDQEIEGADSGRLAMLTQYVADQEIALKAFQHLADRLQILEKALASKLEDKVVRPAQGDGLIATNKNGVRLPLSALSLGEQHIIVLFYEMLFLSPEGTLILIDEPETSMHVVWQKEMIEDIVTIAGLAMLDIVLATHSPYFINERTNLMVAMQTGVA